jgi:ABC-type glycerol-3-phosphate transport system substrate-binding protein
LPTGLFQNLSPSFQQPNPYIPGNKSWISTMSPVALDLDVVPGNTPGTSGDFVVNGDWGGIGFYYNKNVFKAAGIAAPPTSWNQLQADSEKIDKNLGSKGVYAGASWTPVIYNWLAHYFQTNYLGLARDKSVWNIPPTSGTPTSRTSTPTMATGQTLRRTQRSPHGGRWAKHWCPRGIPKT